MERLAESCGDVSHYRLCLLRIKVKKLIGERPYQPGEGLKLDTGTGSFKGPPRVRLQRAAAKSGGEQLDSREGADAVAVGRWFHADNYGAGGRRKVQELIDLALARFGRFRVFESQRILGMLRSQCLQESF